jgi:hypothetical protein
MKILDKLWFTPGGSMHLIGIVKVEDEFKGIEYYIGTGIGSNEETDAKYIAMYGARFPKEAGEKLF